MNKALMVIALYLLSASAAIGAANSTAPPAHSIQSLYREGWDCARGYRRADTICVAVEIPAHAFLDSSGIDWQCERGFRKNLKACSEIGRAHV